MYAGRIDPEGKREREFAVLKAEGIITSAVWEWREQRADNMGTDCPCIRSESRERGHKAQVWWRQDAIVLFRWIPFSQ